MKGRLRYSIVCFVLMLGPFAWSERSIAGEGPTEIRLVLQITVDGLRADLINRYEFGDDGIKYLLDNGVVYRNAHYQHANTETIVGHTTLATGATPSKHGMIGNVWYDREAKELAYNIEDPAAPLLPTREEEVVGAQVDPAQKRARTSGRSPRALLAPTLSDGLSIYTSGRAKVFGISGKDRSAVAMAGKTGKAFWMSTNTGDFITSRYYYEEYPDWAHKWNEERQVEALAGKQWDLAFEPSTYRLIDQDDRPYETDLRGYGRDVPASLRCRRRRAVADAGPRQSVRRPVVARFREGAGQQRRHRAGHDAGLPVHQLFRCRRGKSLLRTVEPRERGRRSPARSKHWLTCFDSSTKRLVSSIR